jgi:hypothetical protein
VTPELDALIERGTLFLLRNTDRYGIWGSGQATVRALTALLAAEKHADDNEREVAVVVNGTVVHKLTLRRTHAVSGPLTVDVSTAMQPGKNVVSLQSRDAGLVETQFNAVWYEPWAGPHGNKDFALEAKFDKDTAKVNEAVKCSVTVARPEFRGYGMMIAEIGLPPGTEVDRGSLEAALNKVDSFEVAPDHVTFYVWPQARDVKFDFVFRARFAMKARAAQSVLYDYYNPDARAVVAPTAFEAK